MNIGKIKEKFCKTGFMMISLLCGSVLFGVGCSRHSIKISLQDAL